MGEIVNLRMHRKRAGRRKADERAAENRALHGMSKADRTLRKAERNKAQRELEGHRIDNIDNGDGP